MYICINKVKMRILQFLLVLSLPIVLSGQVVSPEATTEATAEVTPEATSDTTPEAIPEAIPEDESSSSSLNLFFAAGVLPRHQLVKDGFIKTPIRYVIGATNAYKGFGAMLTYERRKALIPYVENDPSVLTDVYQRLIFGPTYTVGSLTLYAQMDLFGKYGFFRSVGNKNDVVGSGRKALGVNLNLFKGLSLGLDYSSYGGIGMNFGYNLPIGI